MSHGTLAEGVTESGPMNLLRWQVGDGGREADTSLK